MNTPSSRLIIIVLVCLAWNCQPQPVSLTDTQKAAIADSAKALVQDAFAGAQKLSGAAFVHPYSSDPDVRYVENGVAFSSIDTVKALGESVYGLLESLTNRVDSFDVIVLGPEAAVVTVPFHFSIKSKAGKEFSGQGVYSAVTQRRGAQWRIVQSHESWPNPAEVMAVLVPPKSKK